MSKNHVPLFVVRRGVRESLERLQSLVTMAIHNRVMLVRHEVPRRQRQHVRKNSEKQNLVRNQNVGLTQIP